MLPFLTDDYQFRVPSVYTESKAHAAIEAINNKGEILYNIPIYIAIRQHESKLLNDWNGAQLVDAENNIALMAMLGAGVKNNDNTFSGVVMGERRKLEESTTNGDIGIFGFDHGI
jgi:hypothetical protein